MERLMSEIVAAFEWKPHLNISMRMRKFTWRMRTWRDRLRWLQPKRRGPPCTSLSTCSSSPVMGCHVHWYTWYSSAADKNENSAVIAGTNRPRSLIHADSIKKARRAVHCSAQQNKHRPRLDDALEWTPRT